MGTLTQRGIGRPDYAQSIAAAPVVQSLVPYKRAQTLSDMAELARRIRRYPSLDGRGDILMWEDFEAGLSRFRGSGTATVGPAAFTSNTGALCISLTVAAGSARNFYTYLPFIKNTKIGHECFISPPGAIDSDIELKIIILDGPEVYEFDALFANDGNANHMYDLSLLQDTGQQSSVLTRVKLFGSSLLFNNMKLVADPQTMKYTRLIVNGIQYDISSYKGLKSAGTSPNQYLEPRITISNGSGVDYPWYIDDVIVTINEPDND